MTRAGRAALHLLQMRAHFALVFVRGVVRRNFQLGAGFQILQQHGAAQLGLDLLRIEHVEQDQLVAARAQRSDGFDHGFRDLPRNRKSRPPARGAAENSRRCENGFSNRCASPGFGLFDGVEQAHELALAGRGLDELPHIVVENDQSRRVALQMRQVGDGGREVTCAYSSFSMPCEPYSSTGCSRAASSPGSWSRRDSA